MSRLSSLLMRALVAMLAAGIFYSTAAEAAAERIKDLASVAGVRDNQLVGYGLVVGLDGTGDQTTQMPYTTQAMQNPLQQMGISLPPGATGPLQHQHVAAVLVSPHLPALPKPGPLVRCSVSFVLSAKSPM